MRRKTQVGAAALALAALVAWLWKGIGPAEWSEADEVPQSESPAVASLPEPTPPQSVEPHSARGVAAEEKPGPVTPDGSDPDEEESLLRGRVVDGAGAPVPGADVRAHHSAGRTYEYLGEHDFYRRETYAATARTDEDGRFELRLPRGRGHELRVLADGFAAKQLEGLRAGQTVLVTLRRGASLSGSVRTLEGEPIAGAHLILRHEEGFEPMWHGATDSAGAYRAQFLDSGEVFAQVIPETARPASANIVLIEGEDVTHDFDLAPGAVVEGTVRDRATGNSIEGAELSPWSFLHQIARTDAAGHYRLTGLRARPSPILAARAQGYGLLERRVEVEEGGSATVDFELSPGCTAQGRVITRRGEPVERALVVARGSLHDAGQKLERNDCVSDRTGADGRFEIRNLRSDLAHALVVFQEGFATTVVEFGGREGSAAEIDLGDVVLPRMATISGRVVDAAGKGIAQAGIQCRTHREPSLQYDLFTMQSQSTDDDGRFRLLDLPAGTQTLRIYKTGLPVVERFEVELAEGERRRGVVIRLGGALSISGRVLDPDGAAVEGVRVYVSGGELPRRSFPFAVSAADGRFEFAGLEPGEYDVQAEPWHGLPETFLRPRDDHPEFASVRIDRVRAGTSGLVVNLPRAVTIEGRVAVPDGAAPARTMLVAFHEDGWRISAAVSGEDGSFRLRTGERAVVEIRAWPAKPEPRQVLGFAADETSPPAAVLRGVRAGAKDVVLSLPR